MQVDMDISMVLEDIRTKSKIEKSAAKLNSEMA